MNCSFDDTACCHSQHLECPGCHQSPSGLLGGQGAGVDVDRNRKLSAAYSEQQCHCGKSEG